MSDLHEAFMGAQNAPGNPWGVRANFEAMQNVPLIARCTPKPGLGPNQLAWCRDKIPGFAKYEKDALTVAELEAANKREMKAAA